MMLICMLQVSVHETYGASVKAGKETDKKPEVKAPEDASALSGKVVETMDSGGYTYVNLQKNGKTTWVAVTSDESECRKGNVFCSRNGYD